MFRECNWTSHGLSISGGLVRPARIGVFGASGFVGSTLCERLFLEDHHPFIGFVRSTGNAGRIARFPIPIQIVDLLKAAQVDEAVKQCDAVVNCTMGDHASMLDGLRNLTAACRRHGIARFIHLSSIAIYGQDPAPDTVTEDARPAPGNNEYGRIKLRQDEIVMDLHRHGVPCYILVPGNISGPYSLFIRSLVERLAAGPLPLVDGGSAPHNLIHVANLVEAILAAVQTDQGAGTRYFVNETEPVTWRRLFDDLAQRLGIQASFIDVRREEVVPLLDPRPRHAGLRDNLRVLLSADFRRAVARMPVLGYVNSCASNVFHNLPPQLRQRIRERLQYPVRIKRTSPGAVSLDDRYVKVQARRFHHSPRKIAALAYRPVFTYEEGLDTIVSWLEFAGIPHETCRP
jgi:nucleoside-diphosphate-sugar epimerase